MIFQAVQDRFPPGVTLPLPLRSLCDFLDSHGYPIRGCFEINIRDGEAQSWFPGDEAMQNQIAVFGNGSTGSIYALWLAQTTDADRAPVVMLGSEGDFKALATSPLEFCRLLGCGYDELDWDNLSSEPECWDEASPLRHWLQQNLQLSIPRTGAEIAAAAAEITPPFAEWVTKWQEKNL
ncbi:hypothetical protein [Blastopirellula marina]|uniref:SMI1/KNR4 family protein n=1 Tax=Blastopirellula marina TaxID=124 RepID=A0A2S8GKS7_9BACT|nr:hypothetical protein [Blastopirellula marina]PQO45049.1 hypothetical protein C5Y93_16070 [Blastopirellula marina]